MGNEVSTGVQMQKITVKLTTSISEEKARFLVELAHHVAPEADLEIVYVDSEPT